MKFSEIQNKVDYKIVTTPEGHSIKVLQYLPVIEKHDLINLTIKQASEAGLINRVSLDLFFFVNVIYSYTDIEFTEEDKLTPSIIYDTVSTSGVLGAVLEAMDENEWNTLTDLLTKMIEVKERFDSSLSNVLSTLIDELPKNAEAAQQIVNSFDKDKFQNVVDFAKAANGNREV